MVLAEVIDDVIHEPRSRWAPVSSTERLARGNEISRSVHLVSTFNLARDTVRVAALGETGFNVLRQPRGQGHQTVDSQPPDLYVGTAP